MKTDLSFSSPFNGSFDFFNGLEYVFELCVIFLLKMLDLLLEVPVSKDVFPELNEGLDDLDIHPHGSATV